ncbi:hypothetical protein L7F22_036487 [Adiantum nelumboides]|nr:hypothetical protein [Adiantum nelumboides]
MNIVGRLPKLVGESNEGAPTSLKRSWWRFTSSAQRVSPPARIALVVLLCAQIMFLAVVRLGPTTSVWGGQGAESSKPIASLSRNSVLLSDMSVESQAFSDKESKASSEPSSPLPEKRKHRKEKPPSKRKATRKKLLIKESSHSQTGKLNNVVYVEHRKGSSIPKQEVDSSVHAKEQFDELLPSVDDKFLADTAMKESFNAQSNSGSHGSSLDTSVKKEDKQDVGSSVSGDTIHEETSFSSLRKVQTNSRVSREPDQDASKIKQVVTQAETETGQEQEESEETFNNEEVREISPEKKLPKVVLGEKVEEAAIDNSVEFQATKEEGKPVVAEEAIENAVSTIKIAEEKQDNRDSEKGQHPASVKGGEDTATDVSLETNAAKQGGLPTEETTSTSATGMTKAAEKEQNVEELQATSEEKKSEQGAVGKEEAILIEKKGSEEMSSSQCSYGYIYVYDLPPAFNRDIISNCTALNPWLDLCPTLSNGGLGESLGTASPLGQEGSWYTSDQFNAEIVFHNRILQHACLTDNMEVASAFYVPFYAGLDVGRYLFSGASLESRDMLSNQFTYWLIKQPAWKKSSGRADHFMMVGRITWDFRRSREEDWGSGFFTKPAMQNITKLLIERNPWDIKEIGVPYPTNFHPQSDADLVAWQNHIKGLKRNNLFSFAGAPRDKFPDDFRRILFEQCSRAEQCRSLVCSNGTCDDNQKTMEFFKDSTFCLQPRGDSFTRRSTFDCLLAGSIPVFFWRRSAYMQYELHLPADEGSYSVFISKQDVRNGTKVEDVLKAITPEKVQSMQEAVIQLLPKIVYAASGFAIKEKDAFDVAIEGVMRSLKGSTSSSQ